MKATYGKAKVEITARGCIDCGTEWSSDWKVDKQVKVIIGGREGYISLHVCADCMKKRSKKTHQTTLFPNEISVIE